MNISPYFHRLFGGGGMTVDQHRHLLDHEASVLDAVNSDAKSVAKQISSGDREKLDEYFTLVRNIEKRLARDKVWLDRPRPAAPNDGLSGTKDVEMIFDLMVAALQTDSTRVLSYRMPTTSLLSELAAKTGR
ncbi:DUF1552 domain-containing protein [Verrucomicrobia bacterium]|nr:DUF1552 domain-containing protein [Verrucomicrobiota bacterium]